MLEPGIVYGQLSTSALHYVVFVASIQPLVKYLPFAFVVTSTTYVTTRVSVNCVLARIVWEDYYR